jgi:hypothetical protein
MSDTVAALIAFLVLLGVLILLVILGKLLDLNPISKGQVAREAFNLFVGASNWRERFAVIFFYSPLLMAAGFWTLVAAIATAGFACIGAIFGANIAALQLLRQMLLDLIGFIERRLNRSSSQGLLGTSVVSTFVDFSRP